jgi:hypothetical protein
MPDTSYIYPQAYEAVGLSHFDRALWLERCRATLKYEAVHGAPETLTDTQRAQRSAIVSIAEQIISSARDREMNEACANWGRYKAMTQSA